MCFLFVFSVCVFSLCFLSAFSLCVCVFSLCFLFVFSLSVFSLCVFCLCFLSVCFLSVFSVCFLCVFCLCFLSGFAFYRATKNDSINFYIILLWSGLAGQLLFADINTIKGWWSANSQLI